MRLKTAIITLITIFTSSVLLANTLSLGDNGDGTWNVNYSSDGAIGGFQFNVDGATINSASGGAAGDAGLRARHARGDLPRAAQAAQDAVRGGRQGEGAAAGHSLRNLPAARVLLRVGANGECVRSVKTIQCQEGLTRA